MIRRHLMLRNAYEAALELHLREPGEQTLLVAYELGRRAVAEELGVLELVQLHSDLLVDLVARGTGGDPAEVVGAAGAFLTESLASVEMVRRGFRDAQAEAALERRHAATIRRLSSFLADASLASDARATLPEVLQLVAEHARELVDAACCIVGMRSEQSPPWVTGASPAPLVELLGDHRHAQFLAVHALLHERDGPVRLGAELELPPAVVRLLPGGGGIRGWLAVPVKALDGRLLGWIQVFEWEGDGPGELDEALVVHIAEMAAATIERAGRYPG